MKTTNANVTVKVYNNSLKVEITVFTKVGVLRAEIRNPDYYNALDLAMDKLEDQIRRQKTRLSRKHNEKLSKKFVEESIQAVETEENGEVVRTKTVDAVEMSSR